MDSLFFFSLMDCVFDDSIFSWSRPLQYVVPFTYSGSFWSFPSCLPSTGLQPYFSGRLHFAVLGVVWVLVCHLTLFWLSTAIPSLVVEGLVPHIVSPLPGGASTCRLLSVYRLNIQWEKSHSVDKLSIFTLQECENSIYFIYRVSYLWFRCVCLHVWRKKRGRGEEREANAHGYKELQVISVERTLSWWRSLLFKNNHCTTLES